MAISKENKDFIDSLIDYYISESESYIQIAENFVPEVKSIPDTAFGIITGCVYSGFLQAYQNQQETRKDTNEIEASRITIQDGNTDVPGRIRPFHAFDVRSRSLVV